MDSSSPANRADAQPDLASREREALLRVAKVSKSYGRVTALDAVELSVASGETLALLGPNGAGKTTLMQLMAGVARPDRGQVSLAGFGDPTRAAARRALGFAPQALAIYPQLSARENLLFFARLFGVSRADVDARVQHGLELADLVSRADQRAGEFSGGMQRRLNLACAVVHRPQLLLLDEPTVGVDPHSRNHLLDAVAALRCGGMAMVYSTHLMDEADRLCDRVAVMDRGKLLALGECRVLCEQHGCTGLGELFLQLTGKELRD
ncbi:MAG: ABC transporter ATP-binding protein [Polyangiales bacterium]